MNILPPINNIRPEFKPEGKTKRTGVKAICIDEEKCLILKLKDGSYKLVGGGVEQDESLEAALKRELIEECGIYLSSKPVFSIFIEEANLDNNKPNFTFIHQTYTAICKGKNKF